MAGVLLAPNLWMTEQGTLYALTNSGSQGMGAIDWEKIGDFSQDIFEKVIKFKQVSKTPAPLPVTPIQPSGLQVGGGLFGMDSTTLLLLAGAAFLFFAMPPGKR